MTRTAAGLLLLALSWSTLTIGYPLTGAAAAASGTLTISILATTDLHGYVFPAAGQGGLALFGGYLNAVRSLRQREGGAVLLLDAGDAFQGGIESDLSEGALVVDAYNALGYTAAAIGNHEFDFGAADLDGAREGRGDRRGALKARARQAHYPFLAANLIDEATNRPVEWPNVRPSTIVEAAGIKLGIIGVMTSAALRSTLPANAHGLRIAPLAATIESQARALRDAGVDVVLVVAHAGGRCTEFANPGDLSSCDQDGEIFQVVRALPRGLVNVIAAGHSHEAVAHVIEGTAVVQSYSRGQAFARVDLVMNRATRRIADVQVFPPHAICAENAAEAGSCRRQDDGSAPGPARYEGQDIAPDPAIVAAMAPALARVRDLQAAPLGVVLDTPLLRAAAPESALGNLFADALRQGSGADAAVTNNTFGGLRADLPAGPLTFGQLYDVFPFDNRVVRLVATGEELSHVLLEQIGRRGPGALAVSGIQVRMTCSANGAAIKVFHPSGRPLDPHQQVVVATVDSLAAGMFAAVARRAATSPAHEDLLLREVVERWLQRHVGHLRADEFVDLGQPRWQYPDDRPAGCGG